MQRTYVIPLWKKAPFIRLLLPLIMGIILQWYFQISVTVFVLALASFSVALLLFLMLPAILRFKLKPLQGFLIQLLFISLGALLTWQKDIRNNNSWYGKHYRNGSYLIVRIDEPLVEKNKSFKANGYVEAIINQGKSTPAKGKLLLYFAKDSLKKELNYGDRILIHKNLQPIENSGNPGSFNYERFAAFQGIFHNVYLKEKDWQPLKGSTGNPFYQFIFSARAKVLDVLKKTIHTGKDELGIAQALLIGYTNDLDKDLVQAYSNTGVVHIIAISGMHLGLIYVLLLWILAKLPVINKSKITQLILVLLSLWLFAVLTGASPSVMRAAVMFTCIAIGQYSKKQISIFTSIAASAFILLCVNPFYLWAVGFQLSYLAVIGIVVFQKPIYHVLYIKNKWLDKVWQLISVSSAAQLLTFPVCIYYFHQFPNLFIISNIVAVPLATLILYSAIFLVSFSWIPFVGVYAGKIVGGLTWVMNKFILWVNDLPFAVWDKIPATVLSTWLLYAMVVLFSAWLILKKKNNLRWALITLLAFLMFTTYNKWQTYKQLKIIVYNVPQHQAIDFVKGNQYQFIGDSVLLEDGLLQNFHLKPGRIKQQLNECEISLAAVLRHNLFYQFKNNRILIIDRPVLFDSLLQKINIDLLIISKNPKIDLIQLAKVFTIKQCVFDASNPGWKIDNWVKQCNQIGIKNYSVPANGAFVCNIGT